MNLQLVGSLRFQLNWIEIARAQWQTLEDAEAEFDWLRTLPGAELYPERTKRIEQGLAKLRTVTRFSLLEVGTEGDVTFEQMVAHLELHNPYVLDLVEAQDELELRDHFEEARRLRVKDETLHTLDEAEVLRGLMRVVGSEGRIRTSDVPRIWDAFEDLQTAS